MCEVIEKIKEDPGFDRASSFILLQKWLDIVPASADEWPMTAQNVYARTCAIVMENQRSPLMVPILVS